MSRAKWQGEAPLGRMVALAGDAEMDEGNIFEALLEGWKHGVRNTWWVVDYNRQSLDAVVSEGLWERLESVFRTFGWDVVILKYGRLLEAAFAEPGGEKLRDWIDACPNQIYSALAFQGGAAWRKRLLDDLGDQGEVSALIGRRDDAELARLMSNLGGHDYRQPLRCLRGRPLARPPGLLHRLHHQGLRLRRSPATRTTMPGVMTTAQTEELRTSLGVRPGHEWEPMEGTGKLQRELEQLVADAPFFARANRRTEAAALPIPDTLPLAIQPTMSTQQGFGLLMNEVARSDEAFAKHIVTTSPDVTVLDQPRGLGEPARRVLDRHRGRRVQVQPHPLDLCLGPVAARPACRARHRRDEPVHHAVGARPVAPAVRPAPACPSARSTIPSSSAASMR